MMIAAAAVTVASSASAAVVLDKYYYSDSGAYMSVYNDSGSAYSDVMINGIDLGALAAGATSGSVYLGDNEGSNGFQSISVTDGKTYSISAYDNVNDCDRACSTSQTFATPGVPEPASWALMIIGVAGIGASLRSSRKSALAA